MPTREHVTHQEMRLAVPITAVGSNTTTVGAIFDTADYDLGIYFAIMVDGRTDGTYTLKIEDGDDPSLSDAADVAANQLVYGTLPALSADTASGAMLPREGVHSTKRFVRASIVSTAVTTGANVAAFIVKDAEVINNLRTESEEFNKIEEEHKRLELSLAVIDKKKHLTPEDEIERKKIQKQKLQIKDQMAKLVRGYK